MTFTRRTSLRLSLAGLATALARPAAANAPTRTIAGAPSRLAKHCVVLYMTGGASHIDTFDPKPGRDTGGPFAAIGTKLAGLRISEHLSGLADRADRLAVIRSMTATEGNHDRARYLMHTGYAPAGATAHPALGSQVAATHEGRALPGYVAIGGSGQGAGFLGARHGPFVVPRPDRPIRYLKDAARISEDRRRARAALWRGQQAAFEAEHHAPQVTGHTDVMEQAIAMMDAPQMAAFDLDREPTKVARRYGENRFGQGCLLARRLVEAGVPFVEVAMGGWDTHEDNFARVADLSAQLDAGMSALLDDLSASGKLDETLVVWVGDFGRSPRINARGGRDHHPRASSVVLAGASITGRVIGATDADGDRVTTDPVTVPDLMRTIAVGVGLDPDETRMTPGGRPISAVDGGRVIDGLWG